MIMILSALTLISTTSRVAASDVSTQKVLSPPKLHLYSVHRRGDHDGYKVDVMYPQFRGQPRRLVSKLNREIRLFVDGHVPAQSAEDGYVFTYSCDYDTKLNKEGCVSFEFIFQNDYQGAHPETLWVPFNYELWPRQRPLTLKNLLKRPISFSNLARLSTSKTGIHSSLSRLDFQSFSMRPDGLFFARTTQDSAEAQLRPTLNISYSKLHRLASATSPIKRLAKRGPRLK